MVLKKDKDRMWKQAIDFSHDKALEFTKVMPILEDWKNKKILDFGCGAGRDCLKLALLGVKVYGLDISKSNIESAKKLFKKNKLNGNFKLINVGDEIPYTDDFFDGFICNGVLHHIKNPNDSLSEISRVLKNGVMVYLKEEDKKLFNKAVKKYKMGQSEILKKIIGNWLFENKLQIEQK